jgi:predicted transcriptional regulator
MKRQRIEIMAQILAFCTLARRKTRIMYGTNFGHPQFKTYLTLLAWRDLLAHNLDRYMTTEKGHRFLEAFAWLNDVLEGRARRVKSHVGR